MAKANPSNGWISIDKGTRHPGGDVAAVNASATGTQLARHRVRNALQTLILSGRLQPGQPLRQVDLAKRFGVAQSVIRESLLELQFGGLVRAVDRVGMFVSELDRQTLLEAYQLREVFEGLAARLCCEHISRADLRELERMADRILELGRAGQERAMGELDRAFHLRMVQISANRVLIRLTEGYRMLGMVVRAHRDIDVIHREHRAIVQAIANGNLEEAERLAREHVRGAREALLEQQQAGLISPESIVEGS